MIPHLNGVVGSPVFFSPTFIPANTLAFSFTGLQFGTVDASMFPQQPVAVISYPRSPNVPMYMTVQKTSAVTNVPHVPTTPVLSNIKKYRTHEADTQNGHFFVQDAV